MSAILGQSVAIGDIGGELKKLWEADEAATNASLMNFAIYSEVPGSLEQNAEVVMDITREHACRAILVEVQRGGEATEAEAWVTAQCHLAHGKKSVCCEQLSFRLVGKALGRMRNTLFANLGSDLPVVFWWQGEFSSLFEERLYRSLDRLIYDSAEWEDVKGGYERVSQAVEDSRCRMVAQDLAWTRTYHYRLSVAGLFDDPKAQEMLKRVSRVEIEFQPHYWSSAWMMASWLATQAGWKLLRRNGEGFVFAGGLGEVAVVLKENAEGAALGRLLITDGETRVEVSQKAGAGNLEMSLVASGHELKRVAPADPPRNRDLVGEQLSRGGKNSLFRKVWPVFFAMLEQ
ncbi:MAG: glucose-6-phosphate dehydrogenase assembly protein OpcA [Verrucomicrobiota bacterium]